MQTIYFAAVLLLICTVFHFIPRLTRPDLFFAVTVKPEFRNTLEASPLS